MRAATSAAILYWVAVRRETTNWICPPRRFKRQLVKRTAIPQRSTAHWRLNIFQELALATGARRYGRMYAIGSRRPLFAGSHSSAIDRSDFAHQTEMLMAPTAAIRRN